MLAPTTTRVPEHTADHVNARIRGDIENSVLYHSRHPEHLDRRLGDLDREWDIERTLEANAATFTLIGLGLAMAVDRRWLLLPVGVAGLLLQHALQGWCPPMPVFRRLGLRTADEIAAERYALKALRGDFDTLPAESIAGPEGRARAALRAARA